MKKKVNKKPVAFITGITGQDGSYLAEFLLEKGYEVWGMVRRSSTEPLERIWDIKKKIHLEYGNMLDYSSIKSILNECKPDEIYNLAGQSDVGISFKCPDETREVNYFGVGRLINAVQELGLNPKIYQASSSEMFGNSDVKKINEKTPFNPQSPYAESKLKAHLDYVKNYREKYGMFVCSGFSFNHESSRRAVHFVTRKITNSMAKIYLGLQDSFSLGNLDSKRDWGYAKDYIKAMYLMLQQKEPKDYVIATGESHTVREFVNETAKVLGMDITWKGKGIKEKCIWKGKPIITIDKKFFRPREVHKLAGDSRKARKELGWKPEVNFRQLVRIMVKNDLELISKTLNRINMPLSEVIDRYTITLLKKERTNEDVTEEIETYKKEIEKFGNKKIINDFIKRLYKINGDLWTTEQTIGRDQKNIPPLELVGKLALKVREQNKIRNGIKAEIVDYFGEGFKEIKVNYKKIDYG